MSSNKPPGPHRIPSLSSSESSSSTTYLDLLESPLTLSSPPRRLNSQVSNLTDSLVDLNASSASNRLSSRSILDASKFSSKDVVNDEQSVTSVKSSKSALSDRLKMASRRGEERARSSGGASVSSETRRKKKGRKNLDLGSVVKNKALSLDVDSGSVAGSSAKSSSKREEEGVTSSRKREKGSLTKPSVVDLSALESEEIDKPRKKKSSKSSKSSKGSKGSKKWDSSSLGSQLNPNKYTDLGYLTKSAMTKFQKGVYLLRKSKYQMARDKFRAALKARILLYEDISHRALVPGHEILGHVELKLGDWDKATLHFNAAKEICDGHIKLLDEEGVVSQQEVEDRDMLVAIVERANVGLATVQIGRNSGTEITGEMDMSIMDAIVDDLSRYDELNMQSSRRSSMEIESIAEEEEEEEGAGVAVVDKLPTALEDGGGGKSKGVKFSEHRLRMTYISKSQVAEEQYNLRQYEMAISSFNDARSALVALASSKNYNEGESPEYNKLRDSVNKAFISERIADCHVQKFFRTVMYIEKQVNYEDVTNELLGIRTEIEECIRGRTSMEMEESMTSLGSFATEQSALLSDIEELLKTTIQSLARLYSKQGLWCTKLKRHEMAIEFYSKSLTMLSEIPKVSHRRLSVSSHLGMLKATVMMAETNTLLQGLDSSTASREGSVGLDTKPIYDNATQKLAMCEDAQAVWIAIYMVQSHHFLGTEAFKTEPKVALDHYFSAYRLAVSVHRKQSASNLKSLSTLQSSQRDIGGAGEDGLKRALTTCVRSVTVLKNAAGFGEGEQSLLQTCDEFKTVECLHIAHALLATGNSALALTWINNAMADMNDVFKSAAKREAEIVSYMISVLAKASPDQSGSREKIILNPLALYEGGLPTFTQGYDEKHRVYIYWALEEVTQRLHIDAIYTGDQALEYLKGVENLGKKELDEFLWLIDSQIAILVKENEMRQALEKMKLRIDLMSRFRGDEYHEMAKELMRMSCFFSLKGEHKEAKQLLEQSLKVIKSTSGGDVRREIDLLKILATTYDVLGNIDEAIKFYNIVIDLRKKTKRDIDDPAKFLLESCTLLNAIAYCYLLSGECDPAIGNVEESLRFQKDIPSKDLNPSLHCETLILYGNILAAQNSLPEAAFYYDSALSSNPNKEPLEPTNLKAWYNKGVTQFRDGDIVAAGHSFGTILDAIERDPGYVSPDVAFVLNAIGSIHFSNKMYDKAIEFYAESIECDPSGRHDLQVGSLSNIATAYFMSRQYDKCEKYYKEAIKSADFAGKEFVGLKALVMKKLAYVTFKRKMFRDAFELYNEAASLYASDSDDSLQCESYGEHCRIQLRHQKADDIPLKIRKGITAETPTFEPNFVSAAGGQSSSRYRDAVYTNNDKILSMMGVEPNEREKFPTVAVERKAICDKMLGYLLKKNRLARNEFALEFRQQLMQELNTKFEDLKDMVDEECSCITEKKNAPQRDALITVQSARGEDKRKLLLQRSIHTECKDNTLKTKKPDAGMKLLLQKKGLPGLKTSATHHPDSNLSANRKLLLQKTFKTRTFS